LKNDCNDPSFWSPSAVIIAFSIKKKDTQFLIDPLEPLPSSLELLLRYTKKYIVWKLRLMIVYEQPLSLIHYTTF
jgi:hypothetical protein